MKQNSNKIRISSELMYCFGVGLVAFSVALASVAGVGMSMIAAPSFILWSKWPFITLGQWEYIVEGFQLILFCIVVKKFRLIYLGTFATALIYGFVLDMYRLIPFLNPDLHPAGSYGTALSIALFAISIPICACGVACYFKTYLYPQAFDFFVKYVSLEYKLNMVKFKRIYDFSIFMVGVILTFVLFGKLVGIGIGTVIVVAVNGILIGKAGKLIDRYVDVYVRFTKLPERFLIK